MEIKDFVRETIAQITQAVTDASGEIMSLGGVVNPHARG